MMALKQLRPWPRGLAGQLIVALVLVLLIAQSVVVAVVVHERYDRFEREGGRYVAQRLATMARLLEATPPELHTQMLRVASSRGLRFGIRPRPTGLPPSPFLENWLAPHLAAQGLHGTVIFELKRIDDDDDNATSRGRTGAGGLIAVPLRSTGGSLWLTLETRQRDTPPWPHYAFASFLLAVLGSVLVVVFFVRRATKPLHDLSSAAEKLGRGEVVPHLDERGPADIRHTIIAFNQMQDRLHRYVQDRTRMLAAISHDLRSPITALRLRAEMVDDDELRQRMIASLDEMQQMVEATLSFAKQEAEIEPTQTVDLAELGAAIVAERLETGQPVTWLGGESRACACRPLALKRALGNLIDNAVRYGHRARVRLATSGFEVEDDGDGIPEDRIEDLFEPFTRLEQSRSTETGGTGLGLSIARSIARNHGGDVTLIRSQQSGGMVARLSL